MPALTEFLGLDPAQIVPAQANIGEAKWYGGALRAVKDSYHLPPDIEARVLTTRYVQHFYAEEVERNVNRGGQIVALCAIIYYR